MKSFATLGFGCVAILSFIWSMAVIVKTFGIVAGFIAFLLAPLTGMVGPILVGISTGSWILAGITYGGGIMLLIVAVLSGD